MAWENPKTNWGQSGQTVPIADDFNRIEGNIQHLQDTKETPAGAQAKVNTHAGSKQTHGISSGYYIAKTSRSDQLPAWGDIQGKPDLALSADLAAHQAEKATLDKLGHVKAKTDAEGKLILDIPKSNYDADRSPTENDDEAKGYSAGSMWIYDNGQMVITYLCLKADTGSADWVALPYGSGGIKLYSAGNEFVDVTGGWVEGYKDNTSPVKEEDYLLIPADDGYENSIYGERQSSFVTNNPVDLSEINTIYIAWQNIYSGSSSNQGGIARLIISSNKNGDYTETGVAYITKSSPFSYTVSELDVRGLSGEYYIRLHARGMKGSYSSSYITLRVSSVFMGL